MAKFTASDIIQLHEAGISNDLIDKLISNSEAPAPAPAPEAKLNPATTEQPEKKPSAAEILSGMLTK